MTLNGTALDVDVVSVNGATINVEHQLTLILPPTTTPEQLEITLAGGYIYRATFIRPGGNPTTPIIMQRYIPVTTPTETTPTETTPEATTPEATTPAETTPEATTPTETTPEATTPIETTPAETMPEATTPAETTQEATTPTETTPAETTPEATTPTVTTPEATTPADTTPEATTPVETTPEATTPTETTPAETTPEATTPEATTPTATTLDATTPTATTPEATTPTKTTPEATTPEVTTPIGTTPKATTSTETTPAATTPAATTSTATTTPTQTTPVVTMPPPAIITLPPTSHPQFPTTQPPTTVPANHSQTISTTAWTYTLNNNGNLYFDFPHGHLTLDASAAACVMYQAEGAYITIKLIKLSPDEIDYLPTAQSIHLHDNDAVFQIIITSNGEYIRTFEGLLTAVVPFVGPFPAAVWYLDNAGYMHRLPSSYFIDALTVTFTTTCLSLFVVSHNEADIPAPPFKINNPTDTISRAMGVWLLWAHAGKPDATGLPNIFTDVADGAWYDAPLRWAAAQGIVLGVGDGRFAPHTDMTVRHMYVMLNRYLQTFGKQSIGYTNNRAPVSYESWVEKLMIVTDMY